jgi:hypothetical protein
MEFEPKSLLELGEFGLKKYWPNLNASTFHKTSEEDPRYNCVAWANRIQNENVDFSLDEEGDPVFDPYYLTSYPYVEYFEQNGYELCDNDPSLEAGYEKIGIYEKDGQFKHVARQLENGNWTSKIGEYEDIEHYSIEAVEGYTYKSKSYGRVAFFMKRKNPSFTSSSIEPQQSP